MYIYYMCSSDGIGYQFPQLKYTYSIKRQSSPIELIYDTLIIFRVVHEPQTELSAIKIVHLLLVLLDTQMPVAHKHDKWHTYLTF